MARDAELRVSFSDVSATTNVAAVSNDISATSANRSALVTLVSTASQWAVGFSDALNFTTWRTQIADTTNLISGTPTTAIPGDPILPNSTSNSNYFLRAAVSSVGFVGPAPIGLIVQGADDSGGGTAASNYFQASGTLTFSANCTAMTTDGTAASPAVFTPTGAVPPSGTVIMFTSVGGAGAGVATRLPYVVSQRSATTFQLRTALGGSAIAIATTAMTAGTALVGTNASALTVASLDTTNNRILFNETVNAGDTIIFGSVGSITGPSADTFYYVTSVSSTGATIATTPTGSAIAIGGTVGTPFAGKVNLNALPAISVSSASGTTITTTVPHGLVPGQVVVASTTAGGLTSGVGYYVLTTPTSTTLTVSATINGSAVSVSSTPTPLFIGRPPRLVNVGMEPGVRPWLRMAVQQLNGSAAQDGYVMIYNADFSVGKDSSIN